MLGSLRCKNIAALEQYESEMAELVSLHDSLEVFVVTQDHRVVP